MNHEYQKNLIPLLTVCIWGSMYIASGIVLKEIPALLLLLIRFSISALVLFVIAHKQFIKIEKKDMGYFLLIGFLGYFLSNAALMLGIQYAGASFSSLLNSVNPVVITVFAVVMLKEKITGKDVTALLISVAGAAVIIGMPAEKPSVFGIGCGIFSVLSWSFVTIFNRKLTAKYPPLEVTAVGMAIAAVFSAPTALTYLTLEQVTVHFSMSLVLPVLYICLVCTALSHGLWNFSLSRYGASACASFYPIQPVASVILGILLLGEKLTLPFLVGMLLICSSMFIHNAGDSLPAVLHRKNHFRHAF